MKDHRLKRWNDVKTMLADWISWLDETQQWAESTAASGHAGHDPQAVWLMDVSQVAAAPALEGTDASQIETSRPDLFALLATMTSLRQEVNLQTRSARRDREQASEALEQLSGLAAELEREHQEAERRRTTQETDYVHVDALLDLHDALSRAERQASQLITSTAAALRDWGVWQDGHEDHETDSSANNEYPRDGLTELGSETPALGWFRRWFGRSKSFPVDASVANSHQPDPSQTLRQIGGEATRMADRLEGLVTGYRLSLQRLTRHLSTCGVEPISCLGQPVDPELMEVVQIVSDTAQPPGTVTDEIRHGYRRFDQVYRFAQVVATRSIPQPQSELEADTTPRDAIAPVDDISEEVPEQP